jgi:hypothetical protein
MSGYFRILLPIQDRATVSLNDLYGQKLQYKADSFVHVILLYAIFFVTQNFHAAINLLNILTL